jgi:hypothetical protein
MQQIVRNVGGALVALEARDRRHIEVYDAATHRHIGAIAQTHRDKWRVCGDKEHHRFGTQTGAVAALVSQ